MFCSVCVCVYIYIFHWRWHFVGKTGRIITGKAKGWKLCFRSGWSYITMQQVQQCWHKACFEMQYIIKSIWGNNWTEERKQLELEVNLHDWRGRKFQKSNMLFTDRKQSQVKDLRDSNQLKKNKTKQKPTIFLKGILKWGNQQTLRAKSSKHPICALPQWCCKLSISSGSVIITFVKK